MITTSHQAPPAAPPLDGEETLTRHELAGLYRVHVNTIDRMNSRGEIAGAIGVAHAVRFRKAAVLAQFRRSAGA